MKQGCGTLESMRERILRILEEADHPLSAEEIAVLAGLDPRRDTRAVYEHIEHLAKTVWRSSGGRMMIYMEPPRCKRCGYVFKDLKKPRKPSKCPRCHSERIEPPRFLLASRD